MTPAEWARRWAHQCVLDAARAITGGPGSGDPEVIAYHLGWSRRFLALAARLEREASCP